MKLTTTQFTVFIFFLIFAFGTATSKRNFANATNFVSPNGQLYPESSTGVFTAGIMVT